MTVSLSLLAVVPSISSAGRGGFGRLRVFSFFVFYCFLILSIRLLLTVETSVRAGCPFGAFPLELSFLVATRFFIFVIYS